jgi:colanic acid/amylovoran biosynthesis glycosyltransferase
MRRVLYVLRYFPTLSETFVYREIQELQRRGVDVHILALGEREDGALQDQLPRVPVHRPVRGVRGGLQRLTTRMLIRRPLSRWARSRLRGKALLRLRRLAEELGRLDFHRVHAHFAGEGAEWARALADSWGIPYSVTVHANDLFNPRISLSEILEGADQVICIAAAHQRLLAKAMGVQASLVRCGVPPAFLAVGRQEPGELLHVVSVGRWVSKKGLDTLLEAFESLAVPARLTLVSDAPEGVASGSITVGFRPPSQLPALLAEADLFVLPCRVSAGGDRDGVPVAILEAMAAGVPVVTTAVSGIGEVVDEAVGWLVDPDDSPAVRQVIEEAYAQPEERVRRGLAGRRRIVSRGYTVEAQVDGLWSTWGWA